MTREEKIKAIYEEMANKEVSFGCRYEHNGSRYVVDSGNYRLMQHGDSYYLYIDAHCNCPIEITKQYNDFSNQGVIKIIGHPVMIGDALEVVDAIAANRDNARYERRLRDILMVWSKPRKPIDDQSDECIDYVYSLIQKD